MLFSVGASAGGGETGGLGAWDRRQPLWQDVLPPPPRLPGPSHLAWQPIRVQDTHSPAADRRFSVAAAYALMSLPAVDAKPQEEGQVRNRGERWLGHARGNVHRRAVEAVGTDSNVCGV